MTEPTLKPCPFCGGSALLRHDAGKTRSGFNFDEWTVACENCGASTFSYMSKAGAVDAWDLRDEEPQE